MFNESVFPLMPFSEALLGKAHADAVRLLDDGWSTWNYDAGQIVAKAISCMADPPEHLRQMMYVLVISETSMRVGSLKLSDFSPEIIAVRNFVLNEDFELRIEKLSRRALDTGRLGMNPERVANCCKIKPQRVADKEIKTLKPVEY